VTRSGSGSSPGRRIAAAGDATAALENLAVAMDSSALATNLMTGHGRVPHLRVANRASSHLSERIYARNGWYWWSWAERIGPVADSATVATTIAKVLRVTPRPS
jgi:hypothetical protein